MNVEAIQIRLKQYSKDHKRVHQFTLIRYFQERLLYRLSLTKYKENFLLKGGALVYYLSGDTSRYTKDIDLLLIKLESSQDKLLAIFKEVCEVSVEDGVDYESEEIKIGPIQKEGRYEGTRIKIKGKLGNIAQQLQIDIGVGDYVTPGRSNTLRY